MVLVKVISFQVQNHARFLNVFLLVAYGKDNLMSFIFFFVSENFIYFKEQ